MKRRLLLIMLMLMPLLSCADGKSSALKANPPTVHEADGKWEIQRFVAVIPDSDWDIELLRDSDWPGLLLRHHVVRVVTDDPLVRNWIVVVAEFNKEGWLVSASRNAQRQKALFDSDTIYLSAPKPNSVRYELGYWVKELVEIETGWAPGLCDRGELVSSSYRTDSFYSYTPKTTPESVTFRCREWTYQLLDKDLPYINVTSYVPRSAAWPWGGYVRKFIGWYAFTAKKPVIGKHEGEWYCFLDCPHGQATGHIPDISAWANRNSWPGPGRLTKKPQPDANGNVFPDERNEDECPDCGMYEDESGN